MHNNYSWPWSSSASRPDDCFSSALTAPIAHNGSSLHGICLKTILSVALHKVIVYGTYLSTLKCCSLSNCSSFTASFGELCSLLSLLQICEFYCRYGSTLRPASWPMLSFTFPLPKSSKLPILSRLLCNVRHVIKTTKEVVNNLC